MSAGPDIRARVSATLEDARITDDVFGADFVDALTGAVATVASSLASGGKVLICGNGGSAADAQHLAGELVGRFRRERRALPAIALTTDSSVLTALANDFGAGEIFARQVAALAVPGDVLIAISTSGSSRNVILAAREARRAGLSVVALLGEGGALGDEANVAVRVPSRETALIQQAHLAIEHLICQLVEQACCP
jgi:D-sedoheptulose 7-phosphate isomerase